MSLDVEAARAAIAEHVGEPLGLDATEAAWAIVRVVNANMANAVRRVLSTKGVDPRELAMVAFGGNGPVHAWGQAVELGIDRILVPRAAPAFSALGLLVADYVIDLTRSLVSPLAQADPLHMQRIFADLHDEAAKELPPAQLDPSRVHQQYYANICYPGQNFDMSVPVPEGVDVTGDDLPALAERFHDLHEADRGYCFRDQGPLLRSLRLKVVGATPQPSRVAAEGDTSDASAAVTGTREAFFGDAWVEATVYDGPRLAAGAEVEGPALVEEPFTVLVLPPGQSATVDAYGNYAVRLSRA
jgi:N-methylhydantoinase A